MFIAFVTFTGLRSEGSWPATAASMATALERNGHQVLRISPEGIRHPNYWRARKALYKMAGLQFQTERQESVVRELCGSVSRQLDGLRPDLVLASSSLPVPYLRTDAPIAYWTDATFGSMVGFYPEFSRLSEETLRNGMAMEAMALERADLAFYASEWAARSAIEQHGADPAKVHVVPFGPNLDDPPSREEVFEAIAGRSRKTCKLLYIGYDWERKQGDLVVRIHRELRRLDIPSELMIIGSEPDIQGDLSGIRILGMLDKVRPDHMQAMADALRDAHFMVVPSKAECYGMVYAEASAHGLPSVALKVGGVPTVVKAGHNGELFAPEVGPATIAAYIADTWRDPDRYRELAHASRDHYEQELAWPRCIEKLTRIVELQRAAGS